MASWPGNLCCAAGVDHPSLLSASEGTNMAVACQHGGKEEGRSPVQAKEVAGRT